MLGNLATAAGVIAADPIETAIRLQERYANWRGKVRQPEYHYESNPNWEPLVHDGVGAAWPCSSTSGFWELWGNVIRELEVAGIRAGPGSFQGWNDGDAGLARAIWCLVRHLRPTKVVETGVAHGVTSRIVLDALERNGQGHLWSIDLPPLDRVWHQQVGLAVGDRHKNRWTYIKGSSRRRLPGLLAQLGQIDLFIHDSLHTERNVLFELERSWAALRPGGAVVVDDVDVSGGFKFFTRTFAPGIFAVCEAQPLYPDLRRFNKKGLFGIILKDRASSIT